MIKVGVIGYGYWGPNVLRNFNSYPHSEVIALSDVSEKALDCAQSKYPNLNVCKDYRFVIDHPEIDAIAIVTPLKTHYEIAKKALLAGKHVFLEKPITETSQQASELIELAAKRNLILMVDHTFLFTESVQKIKSLIDSDELGKLLYFDSTRVNLGLFRSDVNVIWDLASHDFSLMDYLIPQKPLSISAMGIDHFGSGKYNTAYVTILFENMIAHFNLNWLSPVKIRSTYVCGDKKMVAWDELKSDEKIKIYDKGVQIESDPVSIYKKRIGYRLGDVCSPQLGSREALSTETEYFLECINQKKNPINDGEQGLRILKLLEACDASINNNGKQIDLC
jgi:predicted dehydrogenase